MQKGTVYRSTGSWYDVKLEGGEFIKARIQGKNISKGINFKNENLNKEKHYEKIIIDLKKELINIESARRNKIKLNWEEFKPSIPKNSGITIIKNQNLDNNLFTLPKKNIPK